MAASLQWKHLSLQQAEAYCKLPDPASRLAFLSKNFAVSTDPERAGIELDLYYYVLQFGTERAFTPDKLSVLFSMFKKTHDEAMRSAPIAQLLKDRKLETRFIACFKKRPLFWPAKKAFTYFRDLLLQHSVERPPYSIGLFTFQEVQGITDFASTGYFRHFMLYKFAFTRKTEMEFATVYTHTQSVPEDFLLPLQDGEDEDAKLRREEEEALAQLESAHQEVTEDELEAAGVPEDIRGEVLKQVNDQLAAVKDGMQATVDKTQEELRARITELEAQLKQKGGA